MDRARRPPEINARRHEEDGGGDDNSGGGLNRNDSLLPGMVRTPSRLYGMGDNVDWAAPGSSVWEEDGGEPHAKTAQTPLTGYGHTDEVWATDDTTITAAAAMNHQQQQQQVQVTAATVAAAALEALGAEGIVPSPPLHARAAGPFSTAAGAHRTTTTTHHPYAMNPTFTVMDSSSNTGGGANVGVGVGRGMAPQHQQQHQHQQYYQQQQGSQYEQRPQQHQQAQHQAQLQAPQQQATREGGAAWLKSSSLENKSVAQSIIASAGLPLSMTSLVEYIKEGQPQFDEQDGGDGDTAIYGTTGSMRNYPNLSEPPAPQQPMQQQHQAMPQQQGGGSGYSYGRAGQHQQQQQQSPGGYGGGGGGYPNPHAQQQQQQQVITAPASDGWTGTGEETSAGGWNVQATSPDHSPTHTHQQMPPYCRGGGGAAGGAVTTGPYRSGGGGSGGGAFSLPAAAAPYGQHPQQQQQHAYPGPHPHHNSGGGGVSRHKTESEILSDLLHFHANFFPPPPPPRVPSAHKRSRAALWYHYASKWDITHRLPPPPRTPLPEMELEYVMRLQEMTRVPYHGDGWMHMSERWFAVTQSLFDFPVENAGLEMDANVVMEQAITM